MSNFEQAYAPQGAELEELKKISEAQRDQAQQSRSVATGTLHSSFEVQTHPDGSQTVLDRSKPLGDNAYHSVTPLPEGFVDIPGVGRCQIKAAIAGGLLPQGWTPAQGFDQPAEGKSGNLAGQPDAARSEPPEEAQDSPGVTPEMKAAVAEAGRILDHVDQTHGAGVTDRYLQEIAASGVIPTEGLPEGISEATMQAVYDGFAAQCNAALSDVGANVAMLSEMLDDDHLRVARQATLGQDKETLKELGMVAQGRLAQLPQTNPEAFAALIADMRPEERAVLHQDAATKQWTVRIPGRPEMSFAAAVRQRLVRF